MGSGEELSLDNAWAHHWPSVRELTRVSGARGSLPADGDLFSPGVSGAVWGAH